MRWVADLGEPMFRAAALSLCFLPALALADDAAIRRALEPKLSGAKIEGIQPAPVAGLFEVRFKSAEGVRVVYTDANGNYVIQGSIFELSSGRDLTEERVRKLSAIKFETLPLEQAVKVQRGNGKRVLAMFSDPYCPACKQFEQTLQQLDDVTVYVFMYPVIRPELASHSKAVWCAPDRSTAWLDLALRGKRLADNASCEGPVDKNLELGRGLGVNSTPTVFFANGERMSGGLPVADLKNLLDQVAAAQPSRKR
jgi:thiol:disulfide interchange protein DsbC